MSLLSPTDDETSRNDPGLAASDDHDDGVGDMKDRTPPGASRGLLEDAASVLMPIGRSGYIPDRS